MPHTPRTATHSEVAQRLADSGLRCTPHRELVYGSLLEWRDHPTADELLARLRRTVPQISLATVYNCLDSLVRSELVRAVNFERAPTRYCPNLSPHAHFYDEASGRTHDIELPDALLEQLKATLPPGYTAASINVTFRGHFSPPSDACAAAPNRRRTE